MGRLQVWNIYIRMFFKEGSIDNFLLVGGVYIGSMYAEGGSGIAYRVSTRGEGGSKKAEKLRTYYVHVP